MKIHEALTEVMRAVPVVKKEDRNSQQNFNFRGIDATLNAVGPALRKSGVIVSPEVLEHHATNVLSGRNQTPMRSVVLLVKYTFTGPEGDTLSVEVPGESMDSGDKAYSKAMSVALRTALLQTLALPTDERDPDHDTYETQPPKSLADLSREQLLARVRELGLNAGDVAQLYLAENKVSIRDEVEASKITSFTERLG